MGALPPKLADQTIVLRMITWLSDLLVGSCSSLGGTQSACESNRIPADRGHNIQHR